MNNHLKKLITKDREIRLFLIDTTHILSENKLSEMKTEFANNLYTRLFTCCSLLRGLLATEDQRLSMKIQLEPRGYYANAEVDGYGHVNCTLSPELKSYDGSYSDLVGESSIISITRGSWLGGMFTGTVELTSDSIESALSYFYSQSEQLETTFVTWGGPWVTGGLMIQPLPFADMTKLRDRVDVLRSVSKQEVVERIYSQAIVIEEYHIKPNCNCSKDAFFGILMGIDVAALRESIKKNRSEELECGICGTKYSFDKNDLMEIVKMKEDDGHA